LRNAERLIQRQGLGWLRMKRLHRCAQQQGRKGSKRSAVADD
jgi:hypothetical protein